MTISTLRTGYHSFRLTLGVPLEDVFPGGDIHPSLKTLFVEIYQSVLLTRLPLKYILTFDAPNLDNECLEDALTLYRSHDLMPVGTLISLLRHFLGSLPLPLLPSFTNGEEFVWHRLSKMCHGAFTQFIYEKRSNEYVVEQISEELLRLPPVNLLLIGYLVNFLRSLIMCSRQQNRINKHAATTLVKYFTASMFLRPYDPCILNKTEQIYHPLMLYLLVKWPEIQLKCMKKYPHCFVPACKQICNTIQHNATSKLRCEDVIMQGRDLEVIVEDESHTSSSESFVTLPDVGYLVDTECQTILEETPKRCKWTQTKERPKVDAQTLTEGCFDFTPEDTFSGCYVGYGGSNLDYPSVVNEVVFQRSEATQTELNQVISGSSETEEEQAAPSSSDLKKKYSKIGWSYTESPCEDVSGVTNNVTFDEVADASTPLNPNKSKRSILSIGKLKSKMDFRKIFKERRLLNSTSVDNIDSSVKYKKMNTSKSTLF